MPSFDLFEASSWSARYNIAPTQEVLVVVQDPTKAKRQARRYRWGLIPSWAKNLAIGNKLINAQAETSATNPAFRVAFRKRRCLILADGFYEWKREGSRKQPYYIKLQNGDHLPSRGSGIIGNLPTPNLWRPVRSSWAQYGRRGTSSPC